MPQPIYKICYWGLQSAEKTPPSRLVFTTIHIAELECTIAKQHEKLPFSGVIWVKEQSEIVCAKSYGLANRSEAIPNTLDTLMEEMIAYFPNLQVERSLNFGIQLITFKPLTQITIEAV